MSEPIRAEERDRWGRMLWEAEIDGVSGALSWDESSSRMRERKAHEASAVATAAVLSERERIRVELQPMIDAARVPVEANPHGVNFESGYWEGLIDALEVVTIP